jgi:hypothetical protein
MRLEEYWGIGPKTSDLLTEELGIERAVDAIESTDTRALTEAGLSRGRATRILRRATGKEAMDLLATRDTRDVYKELLQMAEEHAVTDRAADNIRVLTPLPTQEAMEERLDEVEAAREAWSALDDETQRTVLAAFTKFDSGGGELADHPVDVLLGGHAEFHFRGRGGKGRGHGRHFLGEQGAFHVSRLLFRQGGSEHGTPLADIIHGGQAGMLQLHGHSTC